MPALEIRLYPSDLEALTARLGQFVDRLPQLIAWAANRATLAMKREILVTSAGEGFPRKLAKYRTRRPRARVGRPEAHTLAGMVGWKWGRLMANAQKAPHGLNVRVGRKTHFVEGGFVATMPTGHQGVFVRKPGAKRLPIREVRTDSLTDMAEDAGRVPQIVDEGREVFFRRLDVEVDMLLAGISKPPPAIDSEALA